MGYVKLICFCIWAVQAIDKLRDKKVTEKSSGKILSGITAAFILLQLGSGIAMSVYGALCQALQSDVDFPLPTVWWIGIVPIVFSIFGLVIVYKRRRKWIVIWIMVNFVMCLGDGILMSYTDCLTSSKFGVTPDDLRKCQHPELFTTVTPTTTRAVYGHHVNSDGSISYYPEDSDQDEKVVKLPCDIVFRIDSLLNGLTYSLLTYCGLVIMVTVFASVIGCCLQECVDEEVMGGPTFVPVEQRMDERNPQYNSYPSTGAPVFSSIGAPVGYIQPTHPGPAQQWTPQYHGHNEGFQVNSDRSLLV